MLYDIYSIIFRTIPLSFFNLLRLFLFVVCLSPGFLRFAWYYFITSDRVAVRYGDESVRQKIDVYRPSRKLDSQREVLLHGENPSSTEECRFNAPVIVFFTGGAWMIGYKMWGTLLARALTATGIVVVIPDLRNYPLVCIPSMVDDVDLALDWTRKNIAQYGGDPTNIVVVGQSAGGHVACMAIFRKIRRKIAREDGIVSLEGFTGTNRDGNGKNIHANGNSNCEWMASDLKGFAAVSSPLNLGSIINESFRRLGFDNGMVDRMFGFEKKTYDPFLALEEFQSAELKHKFVKEFPPICIYQGTSDKTVPYECSESFYRELLRTTSDKQSVSFVSYDGWSHTDPILEGPMDADHRLHKDLFNNVNEWITSPNLTWPNDARINDRLCPHFMIEISRMINPF